MSQSQRLFEILQILRRHRQAVSGNYLAQETGVSLRTIYRDISLLQSIGAEIEGEPGFGYVLKPGFILPPLMFSEAEIKAITLGAQWVTRQTDEDLRAAAQDALAKIEAVLPSELRHGLTDNDFHIGLPSLPAPAISLKVLRQAMQQQMKLRIVYRDARDTLPGGANCDRISGCFAPTVSSMQHSWPIAIPERGGNWSSNGGRRRKKHATRWHRRPANSAPASGDRRVRVNYFA